MLLPFCHFLAFYIAYRSVAYRKACVRRITIMKMAIILLSGKIVTLEDHMKDMAVWYVILGMNLEKIFTFS